MTKKHYVNNADFLTALTEYRSKCDVVEIINRKKTNRLH